MFSRKTMTCCCIILCFIMLFSITPISLAKPILSNEFYYYNILSDEYHFSVYIDDETREHYYLVEYPPEASITMTLSPSLTKAQGKTVKVTDAQGLQNVINDSNKKVDAAVKNNTAPKTADDVIYLMVKALGDKIELKEGSLRDLIQSVIDDIKREEAAGKHPAKCTTALAKRIAEKLKLLSTSVTNTTELSHRINKAAGILTDAYNRGFFK